MHPFSFARFLLLQPPLSPTHLPHYYPQSHTCDVKIARIGGLGVIMLQELIRDIHNTFVISNMKRLSHEVYVVFCNHTGHSIKGFDFVIFMMYQVFK